MDVAVLDDDVPEIDPDAEFELVAGRLAEIVLGYGALNVDGTAQSVDDARKLYQQPVPHRLDEAAMMLGDLRLEYCLKERAKSRARAFLVGLAHPRVADDIGHHDGSEVALHDFDLRSLLRPEI